MRTPVTPDVDEILAELMSPAGRDDPYPHYHRLHELGAVHRSAAVGKIATGYDACDAILRDSHAVTVGGRHLPGRPDPTGHRSVALVNSTMLMTDPPDHTRLRRLVSKAFTPRTVAGLQTGIEARLERLLTAMTERATGGQTVDLMEDLAFPFPIGVIGQMIGVPAADQGQFQHLVRDLTLAVDLIAAESDLDRADTAADEVTGYFEQLVAHRRAHPGDDLASALIAAREAQDKLSEAELLSMLTLLFIAGFETTTNLLGNGLLALLRHPDQLAALRSDPTGVPAAVEELLRFDTPVQMVGRVTDGPVDLPDGTSIAAGRGVLLLLGAANRDPRTFTEPDRLCLDRRQAPPLSFGGGIHYCLGAGLARLEARLVFTELLRRYATIELAGEPTRRAGTSVRGLIHLPLRLEPARPA